MATDCEQEVNTSENPEGSEKVAEALKMVAQLEAMGLGRPRFNLESPYSRQTVCIADREDSN